MYIAMCYFIRVNCRVYVTQVRSPVLSILYGRAVTFSFHLEAGSRRSYSPSFSIIRHQASDYLDSECVRYERIFCSVWLCVSGSLRETDDLAASGTRRPEFILQVQPQQRCQLNPFYLVTSNLSNKDSQGKSVEVTRHSQRHSLTPSSNQVESTRPDSDTWDTSDQLFLWRVQQ
jgi:hypothetical protein